MPEDREGDGSFYLFNTEFQALKQANISFSLLGLFADATEAEESQYNAQSGHAIRLTPDCRMERGTSGSQTPLWPPDFANTPDNSPPLPLDVLTLQHAYSANRSIILDFGHYFLKVVFQSTLRFHLSPYVHDRSRISPIHPSSSTLGKCGWTRYWLLVKL